MTDDRRGIIDRSVPEALEEETDGDPSVKQMMIENQDIPAERAGCPDFFLSQEKRSARMRTPLQAGYPPMKDSYIHIFVDMWIKMWVNGWPKNKNRDTRYRFSTVYRPRFGDNVEKKWITHPDYPPVNPLLGRNCRLSRQYGQNRSESLRFRYRHWRGTDDGPSQIPHFRRVSPRVTGSKGFRFPDLPAWRSGRAPDPSAAGPSDSCYPP